MPLRAIDQVAREAVARGFCKEAQGRNSALYADGRQGVELLEYEALGLQHLAAAAAPDIHVPQPWWWGTLEGQGGYLVLDYVDLQGTDAAVMRKLGAGLAKMHLAEPKHKAFGFVMDGCCGACPQKNNPEMRQMSWVEFWREYRLGDQLAMLKAKHPGDTMIQHRGAELMKRLDELFVMLRVEDIRPSVLHGDLWSGNISSDAQGVPVIYDPACYYGHAEADFGIARMFGGFSSEFWSAYHAVIPKAPGHERRALLYELHHHLNHYNIFGSGYRSGALALMDRILSGK